MSISTVSLFTHEFLLFLQEIEQWVQDVLPARGFGHIVLTTTYGIMDHEEARAKKTGGKILGFFY
jgi:small subunit ribosomal protein S15Ae